MGFLGLSIQQLAALIVLALVGTTAVVYYVNSNPPSSSFVKEEWECKVNYDFSNFNLPADVKADWNACYVEEPRSAKRELGAVECLDTAKWSCDTCAYALALKYNDPAYCNLLSECLFVEDGVSRCIKSIKKEKQDQIVIIKKLPKYVDEEIHKRVVSIYSKWDLCKTGKC